MFVVTLTKPDKAQTTYNNIGAEELCVLLQSGTYVSFTGYVKDALSGKNAYIEYLRSYPDTVENVRLQLYRTRGERNKEQHRIGIRIHNATSLAAWLGNTEITAISTAIPADNALYRDIIDQCRNHGNYAALERASASIAGWYKLQAPVVYVIVFFDPVFSTYRCYVGKTTKLCNRWNPTCTTTIVSHPQVIYNILKNFTKGDGSVVGAVHADYAIAASLLWNHRAGHPAPEFAPTLFVLEEVGGKDIDAKLSDKETKWIEYFRKQFPENCLNVM